MSTKILSTDIILAIKFSGFPVHQSLKLIYYVCQDFIYTDIIISYQDEVSIMLAADFCF